MSILTRYLVRAHIGPFLFALTVLTGLLFLNAVAQRMEDLAGKGLTWDVIAEFLILSLPHTVALTLPMAVLVAVLYTFSELTAGNEFTAMAAGGVRPARLLLPLLGVGTILAAVMLYFNDRVLPESNHQLKNLLVDINQKSPTFQLREQLVNEIQTTDGQTRYFLQATSIDPVQNTLRDVTIFDVSDPLRHRTIYADDGTMAFNETRTDLYLTLFDGIVYEVNDDRPGSFQRVVFQKQIIPLRGVSDVLQRQADIDQRSDREMSIAMLAAEARTKREELAGVREESRKRSEYAVKRALGIPFQEADSLEGMSAAARAGAIRSASQSGQVEALPPDGLTQSVAMNVRTNATRAEVLALSAARYEVEIHKKWAIAFACIVFVLVGAPIAVRFPRGGVGMVIAVAVGIFAIYWISLIGGERLADRGRADPFIAMWVSNFIFLALGLWMAARMGREVATTRGGGWDDLLFTVRKWVRKPLGLRARTSP